jgi:Phage integrase family
MRHSHATALLLSGVPVHVVSRRMGHADVQTMLNTYAHVTEDAEMRAVAEWKAFAVGWRIGGHDHEQIESGKNRGRVMRTSPAPLGQGACE